MAHPLVPITLVHVGPHAMIITPHNDDLAKFNRDGSTGPDLRFASAGAFRALLDHPFQKLASAVVSALQAHWYRERFWEVIAFAPG